MTSTRLHAFENAARWLAVAPEPATLRLSSAKRALKMDFDFGGGRGFVVARHEACLRLPAAFALRFSLRGRGPANHLELKLVDRSGKNVWRWQRKDFPLPARWREIVITSEELEFAWGPAGGGEITDASAIEIALVAGEAGAGWLALRDLVLEDHTLARPPVVRCSSARRAPRATRDSAGPWQPAAKDDAPFLSLDFRNTLLLGGLIIDWQREAPASGFHVSSSNDGKRWRVLFTTDAAAGGRSYVPLPGARVRHLRLSLRGPAAVRALRWQGFGFTRSIEAFWHQIAALEPRGTHPRWLLREQSLWTPFGPPDAPARAVMNEDGLVEPHEGAFSVEPFVFTGGKFFTWADARIRQELRDGWRPEPAVIWDTPGWTLRVEGVSNGAAAPRVRYHLASKTRRTLALRLFLVIRPFQVTPPWQHFRDVGGASRVTDLRWDDGAVIVNQAHRIVPDRAPAAFGAMPFSGGMIARQLARGHVPEQAGAGDDFGFASGALAFDLVLRPRGKACVSWSTVMGQNDCDPWKNRLPEAQWRGASWAAPVARHVLTAAAHILLTRSGPALQPGPRRYTRSWIRDGAIMGAALLRVGRAGEVRDFIRWYAPHPRADGFVPCCVDRDGPDWLVEHDSHGQWLALVADYFRLSRDGALLDELWPALARTADFIGRSLEPDGLLPVSASHEGYLAQPVHSYWDDFWALRGLRDMIALADMRGLRDERERWQRIEARLAAALFADIEATRRAKGLAHIPASREWADFDPTATANAIALLDVPPQMDRAALERTFDTYLDGWRRKRSGALEWSNYTAYEIRVIGALVRLGRRREALELMRFFLAECRPPAWNQWPEITWRDARAPAHIGDVPHTWIGAEFVLAAQSLFAYVIEDARALVLAAGLPREWLAGDGVRVTAMPTTQGLLTYSLRRAADGVLHFALAPGVSPAGGIILRPPLDGPVTAVTMHDRPCATFTRDEVRVARAPATLLIHTDPIRKRA